MLDNNMSVRVLARAIKIQVCWINCFLNEIRAITSIHVCVFSDELKINKKLVTVIDRLKQDVEVALSTSFSSQSTREEAMSKRIEHMNDVHMQISKFIEQLNQQVVEVMPQQPQQSHHQQQQQQPTLSTEATTTATSANEDQQASPNTTTPVATPPGEDKPIVEVILDQLKTLKTNTEKGNR